MLILFCNKCGRRISKTEVERRALKAGLAPEEVVCEACTPAAKAPPTANEIQAGVGSTAVLVAQRSEVLKPPKLETGPVAAVTARPIDAPAKTTVRRKVSTSTALPKAPRDGEAEPAAKDNTKLYAVFGAAALLVIALVVTLFSGSSSEARDAKAKSGPTASGGKTPSGPTLPAEKPATKPVSDTKSASRTPSPGANPSVTEPPKPAPPPPAGNSELASILDVLVLREKIKELGVKAPRDEVKRLSAMPGPDEPEKTVYAPKFSKNNPDDIRADYESKVEMTEDQNEPAIKVTEGSDRVACYLRPGPHFANRMRIKMRIFQQGIKELRLSIQTLNNVRFNINFKPPADGTWGDVTLECSSRVADGIKLSNLALQHIEVQGNRKGGKEGTFFELSKFDIIMGGQQ